MPEENEVVEVLEVNEEELTTSDLLKVIKDLKAANNNYEIQLKTGEKQLKDYIDAANTELKNMQQFINNNQELANKERDLIKKQVETMLLIMEIREFNVLKNVEEPKNEN